MLTALLQGPPLRPEAIELLCVIFSSLCMYGQARRRFRSAHGLAGLVGNMHGAGGRSALRGACAAAQALRFYLTATDEFAHDCRGWCLIELAREPEVGGVAAPMQVTRARRCKRRESVTSVDVLDLANRASWQCWSTSGVTPRCCHCWPS